jgi:DNA polymerase-3 subunit delta
LVAKGSSNSNHGLILLVGPESFLARRAISELKQELVSGGADCRLLEVTGNDLTSGELLDMVSPSLFGEPVLLVIDSPTESQAAELITILESEAMDPHSRVALRFVNAAGSNAKLIKQLTPFSRVVACEEIKRDADRTQFIRAELQAHNKKISADALAALQLAFTSDLAELSAACAQLSASAQGEIDLQLVDALFGGRVETNAFKIADAALARDASTAITLLRHGLNSGIDPIPLLAALSMRIRQLARVVSDRSISAAALGLAPWQFERIRKDLRGRTELELIELVRMAADTDASLKGASRDPAYRLEKYVLAIATS